MNRELFNRFACDFIGLDREDPVVSIDGIPTMKRRVYLDTTATSLMPRPVWLALQQYFQSACANSHTLAHRAGRDTTRAIEDSRDAIGRLVGYDPERHVVLFTANGATGAINFLARALFPPEIRGVIKRADPEEHNAVATALKSGLDDHGGQMIDDLLARPLVVTTSMEHHSNLLPWMEAVGHHNVRAATVDGETGQVDLQHLQALLDREGHRVRLVSVTGTSNVTGIATPIREIARMAHAVGAQVMVDGAQWVPHAPVSMVGESEEDSIDYLVLSGHKMYAPGSRGALVGCIQTLSSRQCVTDVGGGMVEYVSIEDYEIKDEVTAREEAGTPNIPGSISMGVVAELLMAIGMDTVAEAEHELTWQLVDTLRSIDGVTVYGSTNLDRVPRAGVVSFNVDGLHHGLVAAYLNDFHNVAVRNECFCAHPYVKALLQIDDATETKYRQEMAQGDRRHIPGMVRASLGVYSTHKDITCLRDSLAALIEAKDQIVDLYEQDQEGNFHLIGGNALPATYDIKDFVSSWVDGERAEPWWELRS